MIVSLLMKAQSLHCGKSLLLTKSEPEDDFMWPPCRLISPLAKGEELTSWQGASGRSDGPRLMHLGRGQQSTAWRSDRCYHNVVFVALLQWPWMKRLALLLSLLR